MRMTSCTRRLSKPCLLRFASILTCALLLPALKAQKESQRSQILDHYHHAQAELAQGNTDAAMDDFRAILAIEPANVSALANLGALAYKRGSYPEAKRFLESALQKDPQLWDAMALLGLTQGGLGENKEALATLQEAFSHIHDVGVKLDAGMALLHLHEQEGTLPQVAAVAQELEEIAPKNPEVLYTVYRAYSDMAATALEKLKTADPNSGRFHEVLAEAALTQDDFPSAIAELRKAIAIQPSLPGVHYKLGNTLLLHAQDAPTREEARQAFQAELTRDPNDFRSEYKLGELDQLGEQYASAEVHYKQALLMHPAFPDAQAAMGALRMQEQRFAEALAYLNEACRLDPENETYHYRLARLYQALNRPEDARREMQTFQKLHTP